MCSAKLLEFDSGESWRKVISKRIVLYPKVIFGNGTVFSVLHNLGQTSIWFLNKIECRNGPDTYNNCFIFLCLWLLGETLYGFITQSGLQYLLNLILYVPESFGGEDGRKFREMVLDLDLEYYCFKCYGVISQ